MKFQCCSYAVHLDQFDRKGGRNKELHNIAANEQRPGFARQKDFIEN